LKTTWKKWLKLNKLVAPLDGVYLLKSDVSEDSRGTFKKIFCNNDLPELNTLNQVNFVTNVGKGIVRGLHFQFPPHEEAKLITVINGSIFDVIVDLRQNSSTYLKKFEIVLTSNENLSIYIPKGFAHGYQTISERSEILYLHSGHHNPEFESGLNYADLELSINWPLKVSEISNRDNAFEFVMARTDIQ
jgi:dTDP-4-dehydrorhamnose 3,5-epimerase